MRIDNADSRICESDATWNALSKGAWACRDNAHVFGKTRVGAGVLTSEGTLYYGCNVEHQFRSHDVHAEINAITTMVAAGHHRIMAILVVADRNRFTPCGACMDWVFQFGGDTCLVGFQQTDGGTVEVHTAGELMPYYPR